MFSHSFLNLLFLICFLFLSIPEVSVGRKQTVTQLHGWLTSFACDRQRRNCSVLVCWWVDSKSLKGKDGYPIVKGFDSTVSAFFFWELSELLSISYNLVIDTRLLSIYDKICYVISLILLQGFVAQPFSSNSLWAFIADASSFQIVRKA